MPDSRPRELTQDELALSGVFAGQEERASSPTLEPPGSTVSAEPAAPVREAPPATAAKPASPKRSGN